MARAPHEIELKFLAGGAKADAVTARLGDPSEVRTLTSTYFDTSDRALRQRGLTLRVRFDGEHWVQTVKAAGDGGLGRAEWETFVPSAAPDLIAARGTPAGAALEGGAALEPLFTVEVERKAWLREEDGAAIEYALDQGEVASGERAAAVGELELELKAGDVRRLLSTAVRLREELALTPSFATKAERGFALLDKDRSRARRFEPPALTPQMRTDAAFRAIARAALEQIAGNAERLREAPGAEVIHQMRVGVRRLRSTLSTFGKMVADRQLPELKDELRWLTGELNPARNLDVLLSGAYRRAARRKADTLGLKQLGVLLRRQRAAAYARARSAAESERLGALLLDVLCWLERGPWTRGRAAGAALRAPPIAAFAARALARRNRRVARGGRRLAKLSRDDRHALRIEAKKLRYGAEVFADLWGHPARLKRYMQPMRALQDRLGQLNDIATGEAVARALVHEAADAGEADWAAGRLIGAESAREGALLAAAARAHRRLAKAKPFWP